MLDFLHSGSFASVWLNSLCSSLPTAASLASQQQMFHSLSSRSSWWREYLVWRGSYHEQEVSDCSRESVSLLTSPLSQLFHYIPDKKWGLQFSFFKVAGFTHNYLRCSIIILVVIVIFLFDLISQIIKPHCLSPARKGVSWDISTTDKRRYSWDESQCWIRRVCSIVKNKWCCSRTGKWWGNVVCQWPNISQYLQERLRHCKISSNVGAEVTNPSPVIKTELSTSIIIEDSVSLEGNIVKHSIHWNSHKPVPANNQCQHSSEILSPILANLQCPGCVEMCQL